MVRFQGIGYLVGIGLALSMTKAVAADSTLGANREWVKTAVQDQLNQGDLKKAEEILQTHLKEDSKDAESWARLALIQARSENCDVAKDSLSRAIQESSPVARDAYLRASSSLGSRGCAQVSASLGQAQRDKSTELYSMVALRVGVDSNVMLLPEEQIQALSSESSFVNPTAQVSYSRGREGGSINIDSVSSYTDYTKDEVKAFETFFQSFGFEWRPTRSQETDWGYNLGNRIDGSFLTGNDFRLFSFMNTLYVAFSKSLDDSQRIGIDVPVIFQKYADETAPTSDDKRDGFVLNPSFWYAKRVGEMTWTSSIMVSQTQVFGANFQARAMALSTGLAGALSDRLRYRFNVGYTTTDYYEHRVGRSDKRIDGTASLIYTSPARSNLSYSVDYIYSDNDSDLNNVKYKRNSLIGQVAYVF